MTIKLCIMNWKADYPYEPSNIPFVLGAGAEAGRDGLPRGHGEKHPAECERRREHGSREALLWLKALCGL